MILWLLACGPSPEAFAEQYSERYCALMFECYDAETLVILGFADESDCFSQMFERQPVDGDYDKDEAQDCLSGIENITCEDLAAQSYPSACARVW